MVFSELPAGTEFSFGCRMTSVYDRALRRSVEKPKCITWKKTALNGLSICTDNLYASFDHPHMATGTNRYMRSHGHRLYFLSSLHRYLNCNDRSWGQVEDGDGYPDSWNRPGFLSCFNEMETNLLVPFAMNVNVPQGYNKQYGMTMQKQVLVGIPSEQQLGSHLTPGTFGIDCSTIYTWITDADTLCKEFRNGYVRRRVGNCGLSVAPIIRIKDDAPIDIDENGHYIIRIPEPDFEGDIEKILGLEFEPATDDILIYAA